MPDMNLSEEEWRNRLTDKQYRILRQKGTERPFTGELLDNKEEGIYRCVGCKAELFTSSTKYKSGCGWPSFYDDMQNGNVETNVDRSHGMVRTEIVCKNCGGHLGHVFDDGPPPTGKRYCVNSASLEFEKQ